MVQRSGRRSRVAAVHAESTRPTRTQQDSRFERMKERHDIGIIRSIGDVG